tara:strand:- start:4100 stop:4399 length:300 start_codon:yes stop_codon:yes gene_type:complete
MRLALYYYGCPQDKTEVWYHIAVADESGQPKTPSNAELERLKELCSEIEAKAKMVLGSNFLNLTFNDLENVLSLSVVKRTGRTMEFNSFTGWVEIFDWN